MADALVEAIGRLVGGESLTEAEAAEAMAAIMRDEATPSQIAGFMVALRMKGESVDEITGMARTARSLATPIQAGGGLLDVVGTGGDGAGTFNISSISALVAAAAGARVAKHGNRAASSSCGSADLLEALGVRIDLGPEGVQRCLSEAGIGFLFAPVFHPAFRFAGLPRRELGVRTVFNILGPLCNPAGAQRQALGVAEPGLLVKMAEVLARLGTEHVIAFHGDGGIDELSTSGPSQVIEIVGASRSEYLLDPAHLGLQPAPLEALRGGEPETNVAIAREVLAGGRGPRRDVVLLNAAAALRAAGVATDWREGLEVAGATIDSGRAAELLERWAGVSQSAAAA